MRHGSGTERFGMPKVIPPVVGPDDLFFWEGVKEGKLLLRKCATCLRLQHPPSPMCPSCGSLRWTTEQATGRGTVLSWVLSHHPSQPDENTRIVVLVELDEGVRLVSNLQGIDPENVKNDMAVEVRYDQFEATDGTNVILPQFRPA